MKVIDGKMLFARTKSSVLMKMTNFLCSFRSGLMEKMSLKVVKITNEEKYKALWFILYKVKYQKFS